MLFPGSPLINNAYGCPFWFSIFNDSGLGVSPEDGSHLCDSLFSGWHCSFSITLTLFALSFPEIAPFSGSLMIIFAISQYSYGILHLSLFCHFSDMEGGWGVNECSHAAILDYKPRWDLDWMGGGPCWGNNRQCRGRDVESLCSESFSSVFSLLFRLTLCFSSASLSSSCRNFSLQTWEAMSPASTCKYH